MDHEDYTEMSRERAPVMGGRLLYRPDDVIPWISGKTVAMIGDGPSKRRYIFAPEKVITFAVNKAALVYPCSMAATVFSHYDEIAVQLPPWVPILYMGGLDIQRHNLANTLWSVVVLLSFLAKHAGRVYVQGMDLTVKKYLEQLNILRTAIDKGEIDGGRVLFVNPGPLADEFGLSVPENDDVC